MKKIFKYAFAVVASVAALAACTNEPEEGITPEVEKDYVVVKVGMGENTRTLTDTEGIKWAVGDQIKYAGGVELTSEALTAEDIEDDGYTANFKFAPLLNEVDRTGWFVSTKCHPSNNIEVEYTQGIDNGNIYSQEAAGVMNPEYLFLHSGTGLINITKDVAPEVDMQIAGAIFRIMPYTESYNNEVIEYVEFTSKNINIVGTVKYDRGVGTYSGVNDVNWKQYKSVRVSTTEEYALTNATSRETSKGYYMAIAATKEGAPIVGYTYTVKTNSAIYTFDSTNEMVVGNNEFKNVYLKLENGSRVDINSYRGDLRYNGDLNAAINTTLSANGVENFNGGYWNAQIKDKDSDNWVTKDTAADNAFYENVVFECIDNATGQPAEWLSVVYGDVNKNHWMISTTANNGADERSATVTATFANVDGYVILPESSSKTITITQAGQNSAKIITNSLIGDKTIENTAYDNSDVLGFFELYVDGQKIDNDMPNNEVAQNLYGSIEIICHDFSTGLGAAAPAADWISVTYEKNNEGKIVRPWLSMTAEANTGAERRVLVGFYMAAPEGYTFSDGTTARKMLAQFFIIQKAGESEGEGGEGGEDEGDENVGDGSGVTNWNLYNFVGSETLMGYQGSTTTATGDLYIYNSITIDGKVYSGVAGLAELTDAQVRAFIEKVFEYESYTSEELEVKDSPIYSVEEQKELMTIEYRIAGDLLCIVPTFTSVNTTGKFVYIKLSCYNPDGTLRNTRFIFQNNA